MRQNSPSFVLNYMSSRRWSRLVWGLPSAIGMVASIYALFVLKAPDHAELVQRYEAVAEAAEGSPPNPTTIIALKRLYELEPNSPSVVYQSAQLLLNSDKKATGERIIAALATFDSRGFSKAHLWMAKHLLASNPRPDSDRAKLAERHLRAAKIDSSLSRFVNPLMAEQFVRGKRWAEAIPYLMEEAKTKHEVLLDLAIAYRETGDRGQSELIAEQGVARWSQIADSSSDNVAASIRRTELLIFLNRESEALAVLRRQYAVHPDAAIGRSIAAMLFREFSRATENAGHNMMAVANQIERLEEILKFDQQYAPAMKLIASLGNDSLPEAEQVQEQLIDSLVMGKSSATVHLILGTAALRRNQPKEAIRHFEQSLKINPKLVIATNNLADALIRVEPACPDKALEFADRAVESLPGNATVHMTRGEILLQLGRAEDAITDLEIALKQQSNSSNLHRLLSQAYHSVGDLRLASRHQRRADQLDSML